MLNVLMNVDKEMKSFALTNITLYEKRMVHKFVNHVSN